MKLLRIDPTSPPAALGRPVATLGNFDGLHLGHRAIIAGTVAAARARHEPALVITFDPHPVRVLHPGAAFCCLRTLPQRLSGLESLGLDAVALVRFDLALSRLAPEEFARRILAEVLAISEIRVGPRFRFGHARAGDFAALESLGRRLGFRALAVQPIEQDGAPVSSTRIRESLAAGDVSAAARLLGEPFAVEGEVVRGKGRGKPLVFPTANLATDNECLPAPGVYATRVLVRGEERPGATFLGEPRTFGETAPVLETHLPGWTGGDLYGERLAVRFLRRLRGPVAFSSAEALREQIARDIESALGPGDPSQAT